MFVKFQHLENMNMNYFQHMSISLNYSFILFIGSIKALIHSFISNVFVTSTTDCMIVITNKLKRYTN